MSVLAQTYRPANERLLWGCVAASVLLHALLMWRMHGVEGSSAPVVQELRATIRPAPPPPRPAPEPPKPEVVPPPEPKVVPKPPEPVKPPEVKREAPPVIKPTVPPAAKAPPAEKKAPPVPAAAPQPAAPEASKSDAKDQSPAPPQPAATPPSADAAKPAAGASGDQKFRTAVIYYNSQIQIQVKRNSSRIYVTDSSGQRVGGKVLVHLSIGENGRIVSTEIESSSGFPELDKRAEQAVSRAKPFVPIPPELQGKSFDVKIPLDFRNDTDQAPQ